MRRSIHGGIASMIVNTDVFSLTQTLEIGYSDERNELLDRIQTIAASLLGLFENSTEYFM